MRTYFIVLKGKDECDKIFDDDGNDMSYLIGKPLYARSENMKVFIVDQYNIYNTPNWICKGVHIDIHYVKTAFEIDPEKDLSFTDGMGFETPVIDSEKKISAVLGSIGGIEKPSIIHYKKDIDMYYVDDGFKFHKKDAKVFKTQQDALNTLGMLVYSDMNADDISVEPL